MLCQVVYVNLDRSTLVLASPFVEVLCDYLIENVLAGIIEKMINLNLANGIRHWQVQGDNSNQQDYFNKTHFLTGISVQDRPLQDLT